MGTGFSICNTKVTFVDIDSLDEQNTFQNDKKWERIASSGSSTGTTSWTKDIVRMKTIHPKLFMGSRLSAQEVIDKGQLKDQDNNFYDAKRFHTLCVASNSTCEYCVVSSQYQGFDMYDRANQDTSFLSTALESAKHLKKKLDRGKNVIVHCHSGRNRSALVVMVFTAQNTSLSYEEALYQVRYLNSHRFPMQSTLQNNQFTSHLRENWTKIRNNTYETSQR